MVSKVIADGYFGAVDRDSEDRIVRPASVYCPNKFVWYEMVLEDISYRPLKARGCSFGCRTARGDAWSIGAAE